MNKKNIAVIAGGFSGEDVVSFKSAKMVMNNIDLSLFNPILIHITNKDWVAIINSEKIAIDKNDFSVTYKGSKTTFDAVFIMIHGTPGEDGTIQGYFDLLNLPYTTGGVLNMALTFDKFTCNNYFRNFDVVSAKSIRIDKNEVYSTSEIAAQLGMPVFIKPNTGGSSLATRKVYEKEAMHEAINLALEISNQVIIEEFIDGIEVSGGVIVKDGDVIALPLTEIISENDFFDFAAKYQGSSSEITPARINQDITLQIQGISKRIFHLINCKGMIRVDYIIKNKQPFLIEVNTVPGFSEQSLIPQQAEAVGITKKELITLVLDSCF